MANLLHRVVWSICNRNKVADFDSMIEVINRDFGGKCSRLVSNLYQGLTMTNFTKNVSQHQFRILASARFA